MRGKVLTKSRKVMRKRAAPRQARLRNQKLYVLKEKPYFLRKFLEKKTYSPRKFLREKTYSLRDRPIFFREAFLRIGLRE